MGLTPDLFSAGWLWLMNALLVAVLAIAVWQADWAQLVVERALQHSLFATIILLTLVWQIRAGLSPGLTIHILGITAVTLMLGWALAFLAGLIALLFTSILGDEPLGMIGLNGVITVAIPAFVSYGIMLWERRRGFRNFFAYLFICGFFGAAISVASAGMTMVMLLWIVGTYGWDTLSHEYVVYLPLIMLPEAFINGTVISGLMVFHPQRLLTLEESRYL